MGIALCTPLSTPELLWFKLHIIDLRRVPTQSSQLLTPRMIHVLVLNGIGRRTTYEISPQDSIKSLKEAIEEKEGIRTGIVMLKFLVLLLMSTFFAGDFQPGSVSNTTGKSCWTIRPLTPMASLKMMLLNFLFNGR